MSASGKVESTNAQARPAASARVTVRALARYALPPELNMRTRAQSLPQCRERARWRVRVFTLRI